MTEPRRPDPLHGITLKAMVEHLAERYGWDGLGKRINIRCFTHEPSVNSSLKLLRKTPWARAKVESLYLHSAAHPRKSATAVAAPAPEPAIVFDDGAAYERYMGVWSRLAGEAFLRWIAPAPGLRWLDVGCGNGAFTEVLLRRAAPASVDGIDPSRAQVEYAREHHSSSGIAQFHEGDAMRLDFGDDSFDAAVMPLVLFFVPEPAIGVAEMARVVAPGGLVTAYTWDMYGGGFPYDVLQRELRDMGVSVPRPPSSDASKRDVTEALWRAAGLEQVDALEITVARIFESFDDWWTTVLGGPSVAALRSLTAEQHELLAVRMRELLVPDADGRITCSARANAIRGRVVRR